MNYNKVRIYNYTNETKSKKINKIIKILYNTLLFGTKDLVFMKMDMSFKFIIPYFL